MFKDCEACPEMVSIPAGSFRMGADEGDANHKPAHTVRIKSFALAKTEVTFAQWEACVADGGCNGLHPADGGWGRGNRPVINVEWDDAQAYVQWLSRKTGKKYRLPTEAEFEYSARGGTTTAYPWGNEASINNAHCAGCSDDPYSFVGSPPVPVASFPPNPFGLYDMLGNVAEWVEDCWHDTYDGAPTDGSAWTKDANCDKRVLRGGSFFSSTLGITSYSRSWYIGARGTEGFRPARAMQP
jgi:formylglycine-generating enzyme required for sulfatase activity